LSTLLDTTFRHVKNIFSFPLQGKDFQVDWIGLPRSVAGALQERSSSFTGAEQVWSRLGLLGLLGAALPE
tara:strand:- start:2 stop:211 length:210 start_codon:yes stop_codon:yes gene_type:complete